MKIVTCHFDKMSHVFADQTATEQMCEAGIATGVGFARKKGNFVLVIRAGIQFSNAYETLSCLAPDSADVCGSRIDR